MKTFSSKTCHHNSMIFPRMRKSRNGNWGEAAVRTKYEMARTRNSVRCRRYKMMPPKNDEKKRTRPTVTISDSLNLMFWWKKKRMNRIFALSTWGDCLGVHHQTFLSLHHTYLEDTTSFCKYIECMIYSFK